MYLLLRTSQRDDGWIWSSMTFILEARLDLDAEEEQLFEKYRLYDLAVYDGDAREQYQHQAQQSYEAQQEAANAPFLFEEAHVILSNFFASLWHFGAAATYSVLAAMSFKITLQTLADGQDIESQSLEEIITIRNLIKESVEYLASYFELALTFDGREELSEW
jgi:hypothetical protein